MRTATLSILILAVIAFGRWQGLPWRFCLMIAAIVIILGVLLKRNAKQRRQGVETDVEHDSWWSKRIQAGHATSEVMNDFELRRAFQRETPLTREEYRNFTHAQNYYGHPPTYKEYRKLWEMYQREQPKKESYEHYRYERF